MVLHDFDLSKLLPAEFELQNELGQGAHGIVYKAIHKTLAQTVAIKFVRADRYDSSSEDSITGDSSSKRRILKELKVVAGLDHPHIVRLLQLGICSDSSPFLVYEYLDGQTLQEAMDKNKQDSSYLLTSYPLISSLISQILDALVYAHSKKIVHRDLKPGNIMVLSNTSVVTAKIMDFGLAQKQDQEPGAEQTGTNQQGTGANQRGATATSAFAGSPLYMSPEQCQGKELDFRSDIYSMACIIYQLLLGKAPFEADSAYNVLYQHLNQKAPLPDKHLNKELNEALAKALSKSPGDRQRDTAEFKREIEAGLKSWQPSSESKLSKKTAFIAIAVIAMLVVAGAAGVIYLQQVREMATKQISLKKVPSAKPVYLSIESELREAHYLHNDDRKNRIPDADEKYLAKLDNILSRIKNNKRLAFIAYLEKGFCLQDCKKYKETATAFENCIAIAKNKNELPYIESALVYMKLSDLCLKDKAKRKDYLEKAIAVIESSKKQTLPSFDLPDYCRTPIPNIEATCFHLIAICEEKDGKLDAAKANAVKAIKALSVPWKSDSIDFPFILYSNLLYKEGNKGEARKSIENTLSQLESVPESSLGRLNSEFDSKYFIRTYEAAISWCKKNGEKKLADEIYKRVQRTIKERDLESEDWFREMNDWLEASYRK